MFALRGRHPRRHQIELVGDACHMTDPDRRLSDPHSQRHPGAPRRGGRALVQAEGAASRSCSRTRATSPASTCAKTTPASPSWSCELRWADQRTNAITGLRRRSRPGQRMYVGHGTHPQDPFGPGHRHPLDLPRPDDRPRRPQGRRRRRAPLRGLVDVAHRTKTAAAAQGRHRHPEGRARSASRGPRAS